MLIIFWVLSICLFLYICLIWVVVVEVCSFCESSLSCPLDLCPFLHAQTHSFREPVALVSYEAVKINLSKFLWLSTQFSLCGKHNSKNGVTPVMMLPYMAKGFCRSYWAPCPLVQPPRCGPVLPVLSCSCPVSGSSCPAPSHAAHGPQERHGDPLMEPAVHRLKSCYLPRHLLFMNQLT